MRGLTLSVRPTAVGFCNVTLLPPEKFPPRFGNFSESWREFERERGGPLFWLLLASVKGRGFFEIVFR